MSQQAFVRVVFQQVHAHGGNPVGSEFSLDLVGDEPVVLTTEFLRAQVSKETINPDAPDRAVTFRVVDGRCQMYPHQAGQAPSASVCSVICHGRGGSEGWPQLGVQLLFKGTRLVIGDVHLNVSVRAAN